MSLFVYRSLCPHGVLPRMTQRFLDMIVGRPRDMKLYQSFLRRVSQADLFIFKILSREDPGETKLITSSSLPHPSSSLPVKFLTKQFFHFYNQLLLLYCRVHAI